MKHYRNLQDLISIDKQASEYFNGLPEYVREQMDSRSDGINSFDSLRDYAENLLRGDN